MISAADAAALTAFLVRGLQGWMGQGEGVPPPIFSGPVVHGEPQCFHVAQPPQPSTVAAYSCRSASTAR